AKLRELIPVYTVKKRASPYPPKKHWIIKNQAIWDLWASHIRTGKQPDTRISRKAMHMVDIKKLAYEIPPEESAMFFDEAGELVMLVISDFCKSEEILRWANEIVLLNVALEKNVRKEDAGSIVIAGWSAGSRSRTRLDLARNFELRNKLTQKEKSELQYKSGSVFALFWNLVKSLGPTEVVEDMEEFVAKNSLYKMDVKIAQGGRQQMFTVDVDGGVPLTFHDADLAPPSGVFARNYARCYLLMLLIRAIHKENQPHKWSVSWTTFRDNSRKEVGGHFYVAEYGIRIQAASNKAVFWKPGDWHRTSLPMLEPDAKGDGPLLQSGLAIVTSPRLPK
ncbi:hypothetical protein BDP27DRAFT_1166384, partial [Rhodocollybia butyracea]